MFGLRREIKIPKTTTKYLIIQKAFGVFPACIGVNPKDTFEYVFLDTRQKQCISLCKIISKFFPEILIGLTGGTNPKTILETIPPIIDQLMHNEISLDVEGFLRDSSDNLSLKLTNEYILKASKIINQSYKRSK